MVVDNRVKLIVMIYNFGDVLTEERAKEVAQKMYDIIQKDEVTVTDVLGIWKEYGILIPSKEDVIEFAKFHGVILKTH